MAAGGIIGAVIGGVGGFASGVHNIRSSQKEMRKSYLRQMRTLIKNYNYNQNALTQEERYALEGTKSELFNITLNGIQNNAQVEVALGETGTEGRTSGQISRAISGQTERRRTGVIDSYYQSMDQIRSQKDNLYIQTKDTIDQAEENFNNMQSSDFENVWSVLESSRKGAEQGFMIGSGVSGGFGAMSSGAQNAGSGSSFMSSFSNFMGGFNQSYTKYSNMFQGMDSLVGMTNSLFTKRRSSGYNWIY